LKAIKDFRYGYPTLNAKNALKVGTRIVAIPPFAENAKDGAPTFSGCVEQQIPFGNDTRKSNSKTLQQILRFAQDDNAESAGWDWSLGFYAASA
jgi:hypothetical protein